MESKLKAILVRFPEYREKIINQAEANDDFESLCSDYELCVKMLASLEKETELRQFKIEEYTGIIKELEEEALKYLQ